MGGFRRTGRADRCLLLHKKNEKCNNKKSLNCVKSSERKKRDSLFYKEGMSSSDRKLKFERSSAVIDGCRFAGEERDRGREVALPSVHRGLKRPVTIHKIKFLLYLPQMNQINSNAGSLSSLCCEPLQLKTFLQKAQAHS